jgi:DNA-binding transcriptional LysR family regulator
LAFSAIFARDNRARLQDGNDHFKFTLDLFSLISVAGREEPATMINLNQLRAFYQTAKHLSFTAAANELCITQPAVTSQVRLFEEMLELKLFKKRAGKIHLTDEGKVIYGHARKIFEQERTIEKAVEEMKGLKRGTLRLGTARTYARHFMPFLISRFRDTHPHINIRLEEGSSLDMIRALVNLKAELAIVARAEDNPEICFEPFSREELILILPPTHPLAKAKTATLEALADQPIIMKEQGSGTRNLVDGLFEKYGFTPKVLMETSDAEMIKLLVQHGEGISFLARAAAASEIREGRLVTLPVEGVTMFLDVSVGYLRNQPLSPAAQAFLDSLKGLGTESMRFQGMGVLMEKMLGPGTSPAE